jgi:hypothetical protein
VQGIEYDGWREVGERKNYRIEPFARQYIDVLSSV